MSERLKEIKRKRNISGLHNNPFPINVSSPIECMMRKDIDYLIQEAEEKQKLEERLKELEEQQSFSENFYDKKYQRLMQEKNRYKQALELYAEEEHYTADYPYMYVDGGEKARQALKGEPQ